MDRRIVVLVSYLLLNGFSAVAQHIPVSEWKNYSPQKEVEVRLLKHDSSSSSFLIYLKKGVASHRHLHHHEVVTVLRGKAAMTLGKESFLIKKGDVIIIPTGTFHSVKNMKKKPLIVLSVQSPFFDGTDREWEITNE